MPRLRGLIKDGLSMYMDSRSQSSSEMTRSYDGADSSSRNSRYSSGDLPIRSDQTLDSSSNYTGSGNSTSSFVSYNRHDSTHQYATSSRVFDEDAPRTSRSSYDSDRDYSQAPRLSRDGYENYTTPQRQGQLASNNPFRPPASSVPDDRSQTRQSARYQDARKTHNDGYATSSTPRDNMTFPAPYDSSQYRRDSVNAELWNNSGRGSPSGEDCASDDEFDRHIEEHLAWARRPSAEIAAHSPRLVRPIAVPQIAPGLQQSFSRAWSHPLADYNVTPEEFLAFLDHLNVCKAATPPLQVLSLAGNILAWTPIPYATLVGIGTQAAAAGGSYAVSQYRITHYLARANAQYFEPRGLHVRIAKEAVLEQIVHQPQGELLLAPQDQRDNFQATLRERRIFALRGRIAPLEFEGLPQTTKQQNMLDKMSATMMSMKGRKQHDKRDHSKDRKRDSKRGGGRKESREGSSIEGMADEKEAHKFLWVVIEGRDNAVPGPSLAEQGKSTALGFLQNRLNR